MRRMRPWPTLTCTVGAVARATAGALALTCGVPLVAGCGEGSARSADGVRTGGLLRVGTTSKIDSLNPFVAVETQALNASNMQYPQLVQYGPDMKLHGDWATRWTTSRDGRTWTFRLKPGGKWSDGTPLTAADAAWTGNTIVKYQKSGSAVLAGALSHVTRMDAPDPTTLVIRYDAPVGNALAQLQLFWVLPKHVFEKATGNDGKDLRTFKVPLPTVAAGPYQVTKYAGNGATVFKRNPYFYGERSNADGVLLQYYTNSTAMIADLQARNLDFVDDVPYDAADAVKRSRRFDVQTTLKPELANVIFNSNPAKPKNRELLDPRVREALEHAIDRDAIAATVFHGYAEPWANLISQMSAAAGWVNPAVKPLPYSIAEANEILDSLGYRRGSDGIRVVPATTDRYAQPAHRMAYPVLVTNDLRFSGQREFQIIASGWKKAGVELSFQTGGDSSQTFEMLTAGDYEKFDISLWNWVESIDPDFMLSVLTKAQWNGWNDTGNDDPEWDAEYARQATLTDFKQRQKLVWEMEQQVFDARPYIQLVNMKRVSANAKDWTGFRPNLLSSCKCYFTDPHHQ